MSRHMKTHVEAEDEEHICCGVPAADVPGYVGPTRYFQGREMVGACLKSFKRKDSFLRHLADSEECIRPACLA